MSHRKFRRDRLTLLRLVRPVTDRQTERLLLLLLRHGCTPFTGATTLILSEVAVVLAAVLLI